MAGCHHHQSYKEKKQLHAQRTAAGSNQRGVGVVPTHNKNKKAETELSIVSEGCTGELAPYAAGICVNLDLDLEFERICILCGFSAVIDKSLFSITSGPSRRSRSGE